MKNFMEKLGLLHMVPRLEDIATRYDMTDLEVLSSIVCIGLHAEQARQNWHDDRFRETSKTLETSETSADDSTKERKERTKEKKEIIYNTIRDKEKNLSNKLNISNPIVSGDSVPPLEAKRQAAEKRKKKDKRVNMPKAWIDARERGTVDDATLINYCEGQGYDWYAAKELFLAFIDHHSAKGNIFAKWNNAFYTWVRNDIKYNGKPKTIKPGSMIGSSKPSDTIKELFDD